METFLPQMRREYEDEDRTCWSPAQRQELLARGAKKAVRSVPGAPNPYVITACPDGEGAWFQETVGADPALAAACKAAYKAKFTPEFVDRVATSVERCSLPLTLVDIGGIPSAENVCICAHATHIVLLAGTDGILRGSVHHLERGEDIAARLMVRALAEHLVEMVNHENE